MTRLHVFWRGCLRPERIHDPSKARLKAFSFEKAFINLLETSDCSITVILDGSIDGTFYRRYTNIPRIKFCEIDARSDKRSSLWVLNYLETLSLRSEDVVYLVEDDYLHRPQWQEVLLDGIENVCADYFTLYDHPDKYTAPMYHRLKASLFVSRLCHWRTTPSTCSSFAFRWSTMQADMHIHKRVCSSKCWFEDKTLLFTYDHLRFLELAKADRILVSCIPGFATHADAGYPSPLIDWEMLIGAEAATPVSLSDRRET